MSVRNYLAKHPINNNPSEAFTLEAREDPGMAELQSWPALQAIRRHRAKAPAAINAAEPVWKGYRARIMESRRSWAKCYFAAERLAHMRSTALFWRSGASQMMPGRP